jgi:hypothetical protein
LKSTKRFKKKKKIILQLANSPGMLIDNSCSKSAKEIKASYLFADEDENGSNKDLQPQTDD